MGFNSAFKGLKPIFFKHFQPRAVLANFFAQILFDFQRPSSAFGKLNLLASYFGLIELRLSASYRLAPGKQPTWPAPYYGNEVTYILILPSYITC